MAKLVKLLITVKKDGKYHSPGEKIVLADDEATALRGQIEVLADMNEAAAKAIQPERGSEPPADGEQTLTEGGEPPADDGASRVEEIAAAIDLLTPEDFNQNGRPKTSALSEVMGGKVTADEIDTALAFRDDQAGQA